MMLSLRPLLNWLDARPTASKMVSFAAIGFVNLAIDFGIFTLWYAALHMPLVAANVLAWLVAVSCSYVMNTMITFRHESGRVLTLRHYLKFGASGFIGLVVNTTTLVVLSNFIPVLIAKLVSTAVSFVINFAISNMLVFRKKPTAEHPH